MTATAPLSNGHGKATAIATRPRKPAKLPTVPHGTVQPATLMQAIIAASADPTVDVGKIGALVKLHQEMQARDWEARFNAAMALCQSELEPVTRNQSNTSTNSRYADLAKLAESALPIIHKHHFSLMFGEVATPKPNHIGVAVRISHRDGHSERNEFQVPLDLCGFKGTPNKTAIHGWGSALTYCRRYALLSAFNIVTKDDDDGQAAGWKSSAHAKRTGVWTDFERDLKAAKTLPALEAAVRKWQPRVAGWSAAWKSAAEELHSQQFNLLGGTIQALKDSAERLEHEAHERDRWERNLADSNRGRW